MKINYFKPRKSFEFSPHPYDIGILFGFWKKHADNHFLLKVYALEEQHYADYYNYHLAYTLENNIGSEEDFFRQVWQIVRNRIKHYENQDPFSNNHSTHVANIHKLQQFQKYLNTVDQWNARPYHIVIAEKDETIRQQKQEIEKLRKHVDELHKYEVAQKIYIEDNHLPTVIDLIQQMRELKLPSGRDLLRCDNTSPYPKLVSKYFSNGEKDIPIDTSRNYFVEKKGDIPVKGTVIQTGYKLFKIVPVSTNK